MSKPHMHRIDPELLAKFTAIRPERGAVADFINQSMEEFIRLWGDRPTPHQVAAEAVKNVFPRFG